jgi:ribosomal protein S18 acetylase RimI-like enzyme
MMIRQATAEDIPQMVDVGTEFFKESNFFGGLTVDPVCGAGTFGYMIASQDHVVLLAMDEEKLVGFIIFDYVRYYTVELVSHLFLFYVLPEYRNGLLGVRLLREAERIAKEKGSKRFYCSSTAGLDTDGRTDKKLLNLYKRLGFEELGCFVMKGL